MLNLEDRQDATIPDRLPSLLPEDVVMDGVTSPIKADPEWRQFEHEGRPVSVKPILSTPLFSPRGTTRASPVRTTPMVIDGDRIGYRSISMWAALNTPFCTCCISASSTS